MAEDSEPVAGDRRSEHTTLKPESEKHKARNDSATSSRVHAHSPAGFLHVAPQWYSLGALVVAALTPFVSLAILLGVRGDPGQLNASRSSVSELIISSVAEFWDY